MKRYGILLVVFGSVLWGTDSVFRRPLTGSLAPVTIVFLEHLVLVLVTFPLLFRARATISRLSRNDWMALCVIAIGGSVGATSLFTYSIKYGNPSVTVLLQKTQPLMTILLARRLLREKPRRWLWICLGPALAGAYLVSTPDWRAGFSVGSPQPLSVLAALGASLLWGVSTVFGRYLVARLPALVLTSLRFGIALPALAVLFGLLPASQRTMPSTSQTGMSLVAMALIPGLAALIFYYRGLRSTTASLASMGELAFPITAVVTNWIVLGVQLSLSQFLGGFLLVSSVTALTYLNAHTASDEPATQQTGLSKRPGATNRFGAPLRRRQPPER